MTDVAKRLVGQRMSSHGGKYVYRGTGLPDEIPHVRLIRRVIIVRTEDAGRVRAFLEEMGAEVHSGGVELTKADRALLSG